LIGSRLSLATPPWLAFSSPGVLKMALGVLKMALKNLLVMVDGSRRALKRIQLATDLA
jgi:hypothetical protein